MLKFTYTSRTRKFANETDQCFSTLYKWNLSIPTAIVAKLAYLVNTGMFVYDDLVNDRFQVTLFYCHPFLFGVPTFIIFVFYQTTSLGINFFDVLLPQVRNFFLLPSNQVDIKRTRTLGINFFDMLLPQYITWFVDFGASGFQLSRYWVNY